MPIIPEIPSTILMISQPAVTSTVSALNGAQVQICQESALGVLLLFQH